MKVTRFNAIGTCGALAVIILSVAVFAPAYGTSMTTSASGTFPTTTVPAYWPVPSPTGHLNIYEGEYGPITGTFSGTLVTTVNASIAANGLSAKFVAIDTCYCTFTNAAGKSTIGLVTFLEKGSVVVTDPLTGAATLNSHATIVPEKTSINGLYGYVNFAGTDNVFTGVNQGTYTGSITSQ
jgi:hypothetical protein